MESGEEGGDEDHGWAAIWATAIEHGGSSNDAGARAAACLGGDLGDVEGGGDYVEMGATWRRRGCI